MNSFPLFAGDQIVVKVYSTFMRDHVFGFAFYRREYLSVAKIWFVPGLYRYEMTNLVASTRYDMNVYQNSESWKTSSEVAAGGTFSVQMPSGKLVHLQSRPESTLQQASNICL